MTGPEASQDLRGELTQLQRDARRRQAAAIQRAREEVHELAATLVAATQPIEDSTLKDEDIRQFLLDTLAELAQHQRSVDRIIGSLTDAGIDIFNLPSRAIAARLGVSQPTVMRGYHKRNG